MNNAALYENFPLAISLLDSLVSLSETEEERTELLIRKYDFMSKIKEAHGHLGDIAAQIHQSDPSNITYHLKHVSNLFEKKSIWKAMTEFMRLEAECIYHLDKEKRNTIIIDAQS